MLNFELVVVNVDFYNMIPEATSELVKVMQQRVCDEQRLVLLNTTCVTNSHGVSIEPP